MRMTMNFTLKVWRQKNRDDKGRFATYRVSDISPDASFLEMLDILNADLVKEAEEPVAFDHDCREGICGSCGLVIDGRPHGPVKGVATCELRMRNFNDGDRIVVEPWRARPFPVIKDLVVDRTSMDRIMTAGGFVSVKTGAAPDANAIPIPKVVADEAMDAAACIGCGACVAACKNGSAMLFVAAKVSHLALLTQGKAERVQRVEAMIAQMDAEGFGACSNTYACEAECPKQISVSHIGRLNREYLRAKLS
jgi:succinate dehydrogenase / fumarate reductase iron-sulfur subunit